VDWLLHGVLPSKSIAAFRQSWRPASQFEELIVHNGLPPGDVGGFTGGVGMNSVGGFTGVSFSSASTEGALAIHAAATINANIDTRIGILLGFMTYPFAVL